jgi:hypothetical protein
MKANVIPYRHRLGPKERLCMEGTGKHKVILDPLHPPFLAPHDKIDGAYWVECKTGHDNWQGVPQWT